jgi:hypothetical protein
VQVAETASVEPQVVVLLKALALLPLSVMAPSVVGTEPLLVSVTICGVLPEPETISGKVSEVALWLIVGTAADPVSATVAEPPVLALFAIVSVAVSVAVVAEAKFIVTAQLPETASDEPQVFVVMLKALGLLPPIAMLPSVTGTVPLLVSVTTCGVLAEPATISGKLSETELRFSTGALVEPERATVTGLLAVLLTINSVATSDAAAASE